MITRISFLFLLFSTSLSFGQQVPAYKNARLPVSERVNDLLSRMTPEEKFWQLFMIAGDFDTSKQEQYKNGIFGFQFGASIRNDNGAEQLLAYDAEEKQSAFISKINKAQKYFTEQTRLGIPVIIFDEALHGLVRQNATAFPQAIALAATFDVSLMNKVAFAIAAETKRQGIHQVLSPVINIASDVRWGRTEETYGEDPFLTSQMTGAYIRNFEQQGIITTPKHFLANVGDGGRDSYPIHFNERLLKEIHLPPFKAAIENGAGSVMTSYNSVDGSPATASKYLLRDILRNQMGFTGFVISDASAVGGANVLHYTAKDYADAGKQAVENGLDVIFQTQHGHYKLFIEPFLNDSVNKEHINEAVTRVLTAKFKLGLFENPYSRPDTNILQQQIINRSLAKEAAAKSFVLLQNRNQLLPLNKKLNSIAVIGEDGKVGRLGGYSGPGIRVVSVYDGIKQFAGNKIKINYAEGAGRNEIEYTAIPEEYLFTNESLKQNGLTGNYYKNITQAGEAAKRTDAAIDFNWTLYGPDNLQVNQFYSVQWSGILRSPVTGNYKIGLEGNDGYRLFIDEKLVIDRWKKQSWHTELIPFQFKKDKTYKLRIEFYEPEGNARIKLIWNAGVENKWRSKIKQAVSLAQQSDVAIVVAGIIEGEFLDRAILTLPGKQEDLIQAIAATGKPVIVLLVGGSAIEMSNWIKNVNSVVQIWYPGEAGGEAVADMLFGITNPGGRLPVTFPLQAGQLPLVYNHKPTGRGNDYVNLSGQPLFPFGYGLSYTNFEYSNMQISKAVINSDESLTVSCNIKNTGKLTGDEVVQLYLHDELASVVRPVAELKAFERISLKPDESKTVTFNLNPETFKMYNRQMQWVTEPGDFRIMLGASVKDTRLWRMVTVK